MQRAEIIQYLIDARRFRSYLEIGIDKGATFRAVRAAEKHGVDPDVRCTHQMTSDEFFLRNNRTYDMIFIDGLHVADQVRRDIDNSLNCLEHGGVVTVHDCSPTSCAMQEVPRVQGEWTGDVWHAWAELRTTRRDLTMHVVDSDYGVGIIQRGHQELFPLPVDYTYGFLTRHV